MSLNTAHANNGVLIHAGEAILLYSDNVTLEFSGQDHPAFKGSKNGKIYLTTHRMIYNAKNFNESMQSFSFPFICLSDVELEQPVFGSNFIKGKVRAQENGQFVGEAKFKLYFKAGGAIDFAQAMLRAAHMAKNNAHNAAPPPYTPPSSGWHEAPPPAYSPNPTGYYGWLPNTQAFPTGPPPNSVFMSDNPPPYPGIVPQGPIGGGYPAAQQNYSPYPAQPVGGYTQPVGGYTQPVGGYTQPVGGYTQPAGGYAQPAGGYTQPPNNHPSQFGLSYPQWGNPNFSQQGVYPSSAQATGYPGSAQAPPNYSSVSGNTAYPPTANHGYAPPPNSKEAEAAQSSSTNSSQSQPREPPPGYNESPPNYNSLNFKKE